MSEVWVQVIAGLSGLVTTLAVKYLEHLLKRRTAVGTDSSSSTPQADAQPMTAEEQ